METERFTRERTALYETVMREVETTITRMRAQHAEQALERRTRFEQRERENAERDDRVVENLRRLAAEDFERRERRLSEHQAFVSSRPSRTSREARVRATFDAFDAECERDDVHEDSSAARRDVRADVLLFLARCVDSASTTNTDVEHELDSIFDRHDMHANCPEDCYDLQDVEAAEHCRRITMSYETCRDDVAIAFAGLTRPS
jgi:hypothetical protein